MATRLRRGVPLWPRATLAKIVERDGPACPHCGLPATTIQHRSRRGSGGSNGAERPSNIIGLCWMGNDSDANEAGVRPVFELYGWSVSRYDDPAEVPVFEAWSGLWLRLDDAWGRLEYSSKDEALAL